MDRTAFLTKLTDALGLDNPGLSETSPLGEGIWDSFALLGAIALVDQELGLAVTAAELQGCATAGDLLTLLEQRKASESAGS